ncbi:zinc finger BED domain-containing protein 4-like [Ruditapes philippinarum]|uniref:zinc finger BED domain-containing protein 4-like n=1 Tax=Ruditapes philippinarum TaxID=129788 RepID=UPI00295B6662|nr:zinc finger BED domain-containing protein 4-like [Ruditapes philippinarum]
MLDPRFKLDWCEPDNYQKFEEMLLLDVQQEQKSSETVIEDISPPRKIAKRENFFSFMETSSPARKRHQSGPGKIITEVEAYLNEPCIYKDEDALNYWSRNSISSPILSILAEKYLSIPCTSALVERLFSVAGNIFCPRRATMNDKTFQNLIMIKCNQ